MESREQRRSPLPVSLYALPYPAHLQPAIEAYQDAYADWRQARIELDDALAAIPTAAEHDRQALAAAVDAGKPTPAATLDQAEHQAARAEERCRATREAANTHADRLKAALDAASEELMPLALAHVRDAVTDYQRLHADAKQALTEAAARVRRAVSTITTTEPALRRAGLGRPDLGHGVPSMTWPTEEPGAQLLFRLDRLQADHARHTAQGART